MGIKPHGLLVPIFPLSIHFFQGITDIWTYEHMILQITSQLPPTSPDIPYLLSPHTFSLNHICNQKQVPGHKQ